MRPYLRPIWAPSPSPPSPQPQWWVFGPCSQEGLAAVDLCPLAEFGAEGMPRPAFGSAFTGSGGKSQGPCT